MVTMAKGSVREIHTKIAARRNQRSEKGGGREAGEGAGGGEGEGGERKRERDVVDVYT